MSSPAFSMSECKIYQMEKSTNMRPNLRACLKQRIKKKKVKEKYEEARERATHISSKCDEIGFGEVDDKVVVQLLFKHHLTFL